MFEEVDLAGYKAIPNYSRYLVSERGDVWDTQRNIVMPQTVNGGYKCTNLYREDGKKVLEKVHRLVAYTYLAKHENAANHVVHIDADRMNNHYTNLRWKTKDIKTKIERRSRNLWKDGISRTENKKIYSIWRNIIRRCTDPDHPYYPWYGARGVTVDNNWLDYSEFRAWYLRNVVKGWQLDKDLIPLARGSEDYIYSENTCCFIPPYINLWFSKVNSHPKIRNRNNIFSLSLSETTGGVRSKLYVSSKDMQEVLEKYCDWKDKHIKELLKRMVDESDRKGCRHRLNPEVIELLSNFNMKKILDFT